jgi:hypothetical protein
MAMETPSVTIRRGPMTLGKRGPMEVECTNGHRYVALDHTRSVWSGETVLLGKRLRKMPRRRVTCT